MSTVEPRRPLGDGRLRSIIPEIGWPAVPDDAAALVLALLYQLDEIQWWPPAQLLKRQLEQAEALIDHARRNVPFYQLRLPATDGRLTLRQWRQIPITTRAELQAAGDRWYARALPPGHGPALPVETSGSTGRPLRAFTTNPMRALTVALNLRGLLWQDPDFSAKAASIRKLPPGTQSQDAAGWGAFFESGPHVRSDITIPLDQQIDWLMSQRPRYLLSYPTMLEAIARRCEERNIRPDFLAQLSSISEVLDPAVRDRCREVLDAEIVDSYSTEEAGVVSSQCPVSGLQHVAAESILLEVLDDKGRSCRSGRAGRVVITTLHNFAAPLIRYDIGDLAEPGPPCSCGRGLPVLTRIFGRTLNMLVLPNGVRRIPYVAGTMSFARRAPVRQFQIVQKSLELIEVRLAVARPMSETEQTEFAAALVTELRHPFRVEFRFMDEIPRGANGKYEDFLCEVPAP